MPDLNPYELVKKSDYANKPTIMVGRMLTTHGFVHAREGANHGSGYVYWHPDFTDIPPIKITFSKGLANEQVTQQAVHACIQADKRKEQQLTQELAGALPIWLIPAIPKEFSQSFDGDYLILSRQAEDLPKRSYRIANYRDILQVNSMEYPNIHFELPLDKDDAQQAKTFRQQFSQADEAVLTKFIEKGILGKHTRNRQQRGGGNTDLPGH